MNKIKKEKYMIFSRIFLWTILIPGAIPIYYLLTKNNLPIEEFIKILSGSFISMILLSGIAIILNKKAGEKYFGDDKNKEIEKKIELYQHELPRGHRVLNDFFNSKEREYDLKNSKKVWLLITFVLFPMAYSPLILLGITKKLPFSYFLIFLTLAFVGSGVLGFVIFNKYKKIAELYLNKKEFILKNGLDDESLMNLSTEKAKNIVKIWNKILTDEEIINCFENKRINNDIYQGKLWEEFEYDMKNKSYEEKKIDIKMGLYAYILLDEIEAN